jgi:hypothetical protein
MATRILGIVLVVLALALAILPNLTDCQSQGNFITLANGKTISMKCHWTAQAEIAAALPVATLGVILAVSRRKANLLGMGILGATMGIASILLVANVIGTCALDTHICNTTMKPVILALGGLIILTSLGVVLVVWRKKESS